MLNTTATIAEAAVEQLALVAQDLVAHFEARLVALDGKAMVVGMDHCIYVALYDKFICCGVAETDPVGERHPRGAPTWRGIGLQ